MESFNTLEEVYAHIKKHELETNTRYSTSSSTKSFGSSMREFLKLNWSEEGLPYVQLGLKIMNCQHGTDKNKSKKRKAREMDQQNFAFRGRSTSTIKMGCPARVIIREMLVFPDIQAVFTRRERSKINSMLKSKKSRSEKRFVVDISDISVHAFHPVGSSAGQVQRLDKTVTKKIYELTEAGFSDPAEIQKHLEVFVRATIENVDEENRRFFPNLKSIRNHMRLCQKKNCMSGVDDEGQPSIANWPTSQVQYLDKTVIYKIYELTEAGFDSPAEIQKQLEQFVRSTVENVEEDSRKFFPNLKIIRHHMRRFQKIRKQQVNEEVEQSIPNLENQALHTMESGDTYSLEPQNYSENTDTPFREHENFHTTHPTALPDTNSWSPAKRRCLIDNSQNERGTLRSNQSKTKIGDKRGVNVEISEKVVTNPSFRKMLEESVTYLYKNHIILTINGVPHTITPFIRGSEPPSEEKGDAPNKTGSCVELSNPRPARPGLSIMNWFANTSNTGIGMNNNNAESSQSAVVIENENEDIADDEIENIIMETESPHCAIESMNKASGSVEADVNESSDKPKTVYERDVAVGLNLVPVNGENVNKQSLTRDKANRKKSNNAVPKQRLEIQRLIKPVNHSSHHHSPAFTEPKTEEEVIDEMFYKVTPENELVRHYFDHEYVSKQGGVIQPHKNSSGNQDVENSKFQGSNMGNQQMTRHQSQTSQTPRKKFVTVVKLMKGK